MRAHELPELWGGCGGEIVVKEHGGDKDADYAELLGEFFGVIHSSMPTIKWGGSVMTGSYEGAKANGGKPGAYYGTVGIGAPHDDLAVAWASLHQQHQRVYNLSCAAGMDHVLPKAVPEAALRPLFDWAEKNSDKFFVRRTTALALADNIALRQAMLGMPPLGLAVGGLSDVCFAQVVSPLGCSSMPSTCYWNTTCSERTRPPPTFPGSVHFTNGPFMPTSFQQPSLSLIHTAKCIVLCFQECQQDRCGQTRSGGTHRSTATPSSGRPSMSRPRRTISGRAITTCRPWPWQTPSVRRFCWRVGRPFANIAGKFGANLNGIWEFLTGSGLAAAIVNITNVGGHEGLNVQIEKGVYGADAEVMARCEATSMHPGSNAAGTLAPAQRHPVVYHRSGSIGSTTRAGGRTCRSVAGCALRCLSSTRLRLVVFFYL